jgi:hypothetical protein
MTKNNYVINANETNKNPNILKYEKLQNILILE